MGRALLASGPNPVLAAHPALTFRESRYSYRVDTRNSASIYTVTDGTDTLSIPIQWIFGAGSQTFVLERGGRFYESRVSFYQTINGLDLTMGDQQIQPASLIEAIGRELSGQEMRACFQCHSTHAVKDDHLDLTALTPGVQCQHCHTGATQHAADIMQGKLDSVPPKLGRSTAEDISNFCGQCHRSWSDVVRSRVFGELNVRFQPYRLANSKCFDGSDSRISCVACHDPHREVARGPDGYDTKCLACHVTRSSAKMARVPDASHQAPFAKSCPVANFGCAGCHMPKVQLPGGHQVFTDHDIRVVRANEAYPN